jgi:NADH dehydrogenase [ubiquinone] 1 alpha subcomplex assembly factor 5
MEHVPKIFNQKTFLKKYNTSNANVAKLESILVDTLHERLIFFSQKFEAVIEQSLSIFKIANLEIIGDLENLPFAANSFNLALSIGSLLITNDIPGVLKQWKSCLKPGGVFMGAFFGNETLHELKACMYKTEEKLNAKHCMRFLPMIQTKDAGALMYRAGFANPSSDVTKYTFYATDIWEILRVLRAMGGNCCYQNSNSEMLTTNFIQELNRIYEEEYGTTQGLPVTLDVVVLTGWAVAMNQQQLAQQQKIKSIGLL